MFNLFNKKKKEIALYAPVTGKKIPLEEVPDTVFSSKMMGDGIAFDFDGDTVYAPYDGKISMIANTLHAFGMKLDNGAEVLIHIGLDTVNLNGNGFKKMVEQGSKVKLGTPIIEIDRDVMEEHNINLTMPMVITNGSDYNFKHCHEIKNVVMGDTKVIEFN
ncbi:PTS sugar transporter subunit IIA [Bacillus haynesii]|uniref:PTS sugar transporter subunit IIA n=1 Tax=Bacillus haynesii TaxID=1925021 RepID=UPI001F622A1C|nr:PTS glucose transporter subunit IIA [Bacillus haynesii]MCI4129551.1 PTS glucose transporter subunit IIA [Bacillus haynesii]